MTDITFEDLIRPEDRRLELDNQEGDDLFEPDDPGKLSEELQRMADNRTQVAAEAAALRLG